MRSGSPRSVPAIATHALHYFVCIHRERGLSSSKNLRTRTFVDRDVRRTTPPNRGSSLLGFGVYEHRPHPLISLDPHHPPPPSTILLRTRFSFIAQARSQQKRLKTTSSSTGQELGSERNGLKRKLSYLWRKCGEPSCSSLGVHRSGRSVPKSVPITATHPLTTSSKVCEHTPIVSHPCFGG